MNTVDDDYFSDLVIYYRLYGCAPTSLPIHSDKLKASAEYALSLLESPVNLVSSATLKLALDWRYDFFNQRAKL